MARLQRTKPLLRRDEMRLPLNQRKAAPHQFVLDAIAMLSPATRPMFGCLAVYVEDKIVLILRDKGDQIGDDGVCSPPRKSITRVYAASSRTCDPLGSSGVK